MNPSFAGKVAVVTGGAHGIGKAITEAFRAEGAVVEIIDIAPGEHYIGDIGKRIRWKPSKTKDASGALPARILVYVRPAAHVSKG